MLAGKLLIRAGLTSGYNVTYIPSYGAEVRGGTAHCHVIISPEEIASPIIERPDACLVMNGPSLQKFIPRIRPAGRMIVNSSLAGEEGKRKDIRTIRIPAGEIAEAAGNIKAANMAMLGSYLAGSSLLTLETVRKTLIDFLPARHRDLLEINLKALRNGYDYSRTNGE